ncbi:threonine synthase [Halanaerobium sp. MA284_MarDTE_T2]|nr:threonine synthase [Halanaerobium sp. MA284_MarDTE_T2]RCW80828.1 threonine synthase [Halanaerobium sp. DL-01]
MGNSTAAYGSRAGIKTAVFLPHYTSEEKISAIGIHGAEIFKIKTDNYSDMKNAILNRAEKLKIRVVSGNGPIRIEGYKSTAFELFEQTGGNLPDYIAVPTSACGHIRGIFKGFRELKEASIIEKMPKMIAVQSKNINPIVAAIKNNREDIIPALNKNSIAEAITTGRPYGGREIIDKIYKYGWLAEDVSEEEIIRAQKLIAEDGFFVEAASATTAAAVKQLIEMGKIKASEKVLLMLTGSGLKDLESVKDYTYNINKVDLDNIEEWMTADE